MRCIVWSGNSASPKTLTEKDWWKVATSDALFARKFDSRYSLGVFSLLNKYIMEDEDVHISSTGFWKNSNYVGHCYDNGLAEGLLHLLPFMEVKTIADFGCGPGWYVSLFRQHGYEADGYDGNPNVEQMSAPLFEDGFYCQCVNLTDELEADEPFDLVFSLEVGEHIPVEWEDVFLRNLVNNSARYIILSWAVEGQKGDGHVNCRSNSYIIRKMLNCGFAFNSPASHYLRTCAKLFWLKHTIMVFERMEEMTLPFASNLLKNVNKNRLALHSRRFLLSLHIV